MKTQIRKPIRLKATNAPATREVRAMQAELEGRSSHAGAKRAIWTREFLASGKFGKVGEN